MADNEKDPFADMTNQQPDSFTGPFEDTDSRVNKDLQFGYRAYARENKESLSRVRGLLEARLRQGEQQTNIYSLKDFHQQRQKENKMQNKPKREGRLARTLSILVAALVVIVLIGGAAVLFNFRNQISQVGPAPKPTPTATTKQVPSPTPAYMGPVLPDAGAQYITSRGLDTKLNIPVTMGNIKAIIQSGYADGQRVILRYLSTGDVNAQQMTMDQLTLADGRSLAGGDDGSVQDPKTHQTISLASFDTSHVSADTKELQLTADFFAGPGYSNTTVKFSLPFHPEKHVITVNQTRVIGGVPVTLDHVAISLSQTTFYLKTNGHDTALKTTGPLLTPGANAKDDLATNVAPSGGMAWSKDGVSKEYIGWVSNYNLPLTDHAGTWTFKVFPDLVSGTGTIPGIFTFTVPPMQ